MSNIDELLHKGSFTVILDACLLYPFSLRDYLLRLAEVNLYRPRWTDEINTEWKRSLLEKIEIEEGVIDRTIRLMNEAFPEARVHGYTKLVGSINLPDPDDRHVVAAAIRCNADLIVTHNIKDFPHSELSDYDIEVQTPDEFILNLIDLDPTNCCKALRNQLNDLNNPPMSQGELLKRLKKVGIGKSAKKLKIIC